ncbi:MAG TPA: GrpB family protein [Thermoanaerobaculia bacterium]|nr:GrpB family protein [Thermoanaerobaculia bacterium]
MRGSSDRLQEALRISRAIREFEGTIRDDREPIARKVRRWQRLRAPHVPDWAQELRPHDPAWGERFAREAGRIREALGEDAVHDVQHIGSSAIPHLCSKPVLDMMVAARGELPALVEAFAPLGYEHYGNSPCDHEADWLWNTEGEDCLLVVHLCAPGNPWRGTAVNFRDYLCAHPEEADLYDRRKKELSAGDGSLLEYSLGKLALFYELSGRADIWKASTPGSPVTKSAPNALDGVQAPGGTPP